MKRALVVVALLATAPAAIAAPSKPGIAAEDAPGLKKKGDDAMLELRYEDALDAYAASYAITPNPALHYNRARALEALGRYAEALEFYERFKKEAPAELLAKVPQLDEHMAGVAKRVSSLHLKIALPGARVTLRGVVLGTTPLKAPLRVNAGKAKLEITAEGYHPYEREIELPGGGAFTVEVELKPRVVDAAQLTIEADPAASVELDGKPLGTTPVDAHVTPGSHTVTLSRSGYLTRTTTVVATAGEHKRVSLTLEGEPGIASRWWFWTTVGVVAAGGAVLTISLMTSRDAGQGDIAPGRVSAPLIRF